MRSADRETIVQTSLAFQKFSVQNFLGSHCTGLVRIFALQNKLTGLKASHAVASDAGMIFDSQKYRANSIGIAPSAGWAANKPLPQIDKQKQ